jgi:hypothetical protein
VGYTKAQIVSQALGRLGIADYEFDITAEEIASGVNRLEQMMALWNSKGLRIPYVPGNDPGQDANISMAAMEAVVANLAIRLAASYGKQVSLEVMSQAKTALDSLMRVSSWPVERPMYHYPKGAGYKNYTDPFFPEEPKHTLQEASYLDYDSSIQVGDVGTVIRVDIDTDISTAVSTKIKYQKPSGETGEWDAVVVDNGVEYVTQSGDIDEYGVWHIQAFFDLSSWQGSSKVVSITVGRSL